VLKGWLPRDLVPNYYFEADVGINCEKDIYEVQLGSKHRILDWSRAALPVVSTRVTELSLAIERERSGFVCAPEDPAALGDAILEALSRREELPELGQRFRQTMRRLYGFGETTRELRRWAAEPSFATDRDLSPLCVGAWQRARSRGEELRSDPAPADVPSASPEPTRLVELPASLESRPQPVTPSRDPLSGIRVLGPSVPCEDGSEQRILEILEEAADRSSHSSELATQIRDWRLRYHLSRHRGFLLLPFAVGPGMRVLEVGAGMGATTRYLGEVGADVMALEGSLVRARAAALRCADLAGVEVVCGSLEQLRDDDGFDLVVAAGALETAGVAAGGQPSPERFLEQAISLLRPRGALIIALENQRGLKYLLGYHEEELGVPWAGVDSHPGRPGVETFTRRRLRGLLETVGLPAQRWFFPFPDFKLPTVILTEDAYVGDFAPLFVDQMVRGRVRSLDQERHRLCDDRAVHRAFLEEDLGLETANSFLVLAAADGEDVARLVKPETLVWSFGEERQPTWSRHQVVKRTESGLRVRGFSDSGVEAERSKGWLCQDPNKDQEYILGPTCEQLALDACRRMRFPELKQVLERWRAYLASHETSRPDDQGPTHPFLAHGGDRLLPPQFVDVSLANFVAVGGRLQYVDQEWRALGGVEAPLVMTRALWYFARDLVMSGAAHPWPDDVRIDELACNLGQLCRLTVDSQLLKSFRRAEAALQRLVSGVEVASFEDEYERQGSMSRVSAAIARFAPHADQLPENGPQDGRLTEGSAAPERSGQELGVSRRWAENMRSQLVDLLQELDGLRAGRDGVLQELDELRAGRDGVLQELDELRAGRHDLLQEMGELRDDHNDLNERLSASEARVNTLATWREAFERRLTVRVYRALQGETKPWHDVGAGDRRD
jgi:SAM-dependent methyltransferase